MPSTQQHYTPEVLRAQFSESISHIFHQVQLTNANHTKNFVTLYKAHVEAAEHTIETSRGLQIIGEKYFREVFASYLLRVLATKKGTVAADRVLRFVGGYIKFMNEKAMEESANQGIEDDEDDEETPASRFTAFLLNFLIDGFVSRDKNVRYRVLYTLQGMITYLGEIEPETYIALQDALLERMHDREATVRSNVAACLATLAGSEGSSEVDDEISVLNVLVEAMAYDSSPEVRRSILMNLAINTRTLPSIIERTRDTDQNIRKLVYDHKLAKNIQGDDTIPGSLGPTHPRTLTISQREAIVKNGLGDRDNTVKGAATLLILKWMDTVSVKAEDPDVKSENVKNCIEDKLLPLLTLFDLNADNTVASDALQTVLQAKAELLDDINFDAEYWKDLTPEKAFLARIFVDYCKSNKDETRLETSLPVVTAIAFRIQETYNKYVEFQATFDDLKAAKPVDEFELNEWDDRNASQEYIISELLKMAVNLDYSDEIGRRKTFQLVRNMLAAELLPEVVMEPCLDVLRELSSTEHDLILLVVETVQELRDNVIEDSGAEITGAQDLNPSLDVPENSSVHPLPTTLTPEQQQRMDAIDSKCLTMCIGMLERVNSTFEENISLSGVLTSLIIPSAQKQDGMLRDKGTKALALCCLIARRLALQTFKFFMGKLSTSPPNIRLTLAHALIDIFMVHKDIIFKAETNNLEMITSFLTTQIQNEEDHEVQAILCQGIAKMVICGIITDVEAVKTLLKIYISPLTTANNTIRQALTLFFEIYSHHSSLENQQRMREIFILIFLDVCEDRRQANEADEDIEIMESAQIANMFVGWTDPLQLSKAVNERDSQEGKIANECVQLDMAKDVITLLFEKDLKVEIEKEDKRVLCQTLNKLHIPDIVDDYRIRSLKLLMVNLRTRRPLRDLISKTAFTKFEATITKRFETQLEHFSEDEFRELEELQDLFMFLDSIIPLDEEDAFETETRGKGRKRRSESVVSTTTDSRSGSPTARTSKGKSMAKRPRISTTDDDDDDASTQRGTPRPSVMPTRTVPKRAAASRKPSQVIVISSDSEECDEGPSNQKEGYRARFRPSVKQEFEESELDKDIDSIIDGNSSAMNEVSYDSIMGPDSDEEEEDEVSGLLAED